MRALVFSDTHTQAFIALNVIRIQSKEKPVNMILHLGDMVEDANIIKEKFKHIKVENVLGNCDRGKEGQSVKIVNVGGKEILMLHGDKFNVKKGINDLVLATKTRNIDAVLFGHTHTTHNQIIENKLYFNPGTTSFEGTSHTYGIIEVANGKLNANIVKIENIEKYLTYDF